VRLTALRALRVLHRLLGDALPPAAFALRLPGVPGRVHADDAMLRSPRADGIRHYVTDAESAMRNLDASLAAVNRTFDSVVACLDFPSGYGRVTRHLVCRLGAARVAVADVDRRAVRFCRHEFGVRGLVTPMDPSALRLPETYDLIFVGSLLTHLPPSTSVALLGALSRSLRATGLLVFTTQGESCLAHLDWYGADFSAAADRFRLGVAREGACFVAYRGRPAYGITILTRAWVEDAIGAALGDRLRLVRFVERGWDAHQDVWTYQAVG
jgi:SAM-dependent methyltransferase